MNLKLATLEYVALKQSMGMKFETEAALLRSFIKQMGDAVAVATVTSKDVLRYLNGRKAGPVTLFWHRKHDVLKGFCPSSRYASWQCSSPNICARGCAGWIGGVLG